jgi:prolyl oligopeptidase
MVPSFSRDLPLWLEQGGILAIANLRGGGEFGEAWHQAGARMHKQNVFDDFIACAEALVSQKYTSPEKLAIEGGSNGGLLMGAALTQRPVLFRAVVARVGYFDMLRYETRPNGQFNSTEYGSVSNREEYQALKTYSPYHRVYEGVKYPPVLFMTGANDPRVDPMHSRKMVAKLQTVGGTAYLRTSGSTGHGGGTPLSEQISEEVDVYSFLFHELGVTYLPVAD